MLIDGLLIAYCLLLLTASIVDRVFSRWLKNEVKLNGNTYNYKEILSITHSVLSVLMMIALIYLKFYYKE